MAGSSMNTAVSPTRAKSCSETMKLAELKRSSPLAASVASVSVRSVPPIAVAHGVDLGTARDLARHIARLQGAEVHVVLDADFIHRRVRVLPGDHEHREALADQIADHAVLRLHVEDVELVDPG